MDHLRSGTCKNVYDASNWISKHPGGADILKGVEANKHYQNPKLYPDPPTRLFSCPCSRISYDFWLEKLCSKDNDLLKLVDIFNNVSFYKK